VFLAKCIQGEQWQRPGPFGFCKGARIVVEAGKRCRTPDMPPDMWILADSGFDAHINFEIDIGSQVLLTLFISNSDGRRLYVKLKHFGKQGEERTLADGAPSYVVKQVGGWFACIAINCAQVPPHPCLNLFA
jgi:hypothetical protein